MKSLFGKPRYINKETHFVLPCGALHREYGAAIVQGASDKHYYLFGIQISRQIWKEIYEEIPSSEEDCEYETLAWARLLVPHLKNPNDLNQLKEVLARYYSIEIAENICLVGSL